MASNNKSPGSNRHPSVSSTTNIDQNDEISICPICVDRFEVSGIKQPKQMSCGHALCEECVRTLLARPRAGPSQALTFENNSLRVRPPNEIECPQCRKYTKVPAEGLPTNYPLTQLLHQLETLNTNKAEEQKPSSSNAADKNTHCCSGCLQMCTDDATFYCVTCNRDDLHTLCAKCIVRGHNGHDILDAAELLSRQQTLELEVMGEIDRMTNLCPNVQQNDIQSMQVAYENCAKYIRSFTEFQANHLRTSMCSAAESEQKSIAVLDHIRTQSRTGSETVNRMVVELGQPRSDIVDKLESLVQRWRQILEETPNKEAQMPGPSGSGDANVYRFSSEPELAAQRRRTQRIYVKPPKK